MLRLRMRRRKGERNCKGRRYGSSDHLIVRCEAANLKGDRTLLESAQSACRNGSAAAWSPSDHYLSTKSDFCHVTFALLHGGSMDRLKRVGPYLRCFCVG